MLTFEEFQQYVRENIIEYMPVAYKNAKVFVDNTVKNNGLELVGLCVQKEGSNIGPRVYLEGAYGAYGDGAVLEDIMNSIARSIVDFVPPMEYENLGERLRDFEWVKDRLCMKMINLRKNMNLLKEVPYFRWEDLAVVYQINVATTKEETHVAIVSNALLEEWGVDKATVHKFAMENSRRINPATVQPMSSVLAGLAQNLGMEVSEVEEHPGISFPLYVISNTKRVNGAAAILYDESVLEKLGNYFGEDFLLLPSSVHEWIAIPSQCKGTVTDIGYFHNMVKEINMTQVSADEVLADNVYYCSIKNDYRVSALFDQDKIIRAGSLNR